MLTRLTKIATVRRTPQLLQTARFASGGRTTAFTNARDIWGGSQFDIKTPAEAQALKELVATQQATQAAFFEEMATSCR